MTLTLPTLRERYVKNTRLDRYAYNSSGLLTTLIVGYCQHSYTEKQTYLGCSENSVNTGNETEGQTISAKTAPSHAHTI